MIPKLAQSTSIAALIAMKYWMPSRIKQLAGMSSIRMPSAELQSQNYNPHQPTRTMITTHTKTFATKSHMMQFWRDFHAELIGCHEVGQEGEYVLKFSLKS